MVTTEKGTFIETVQENGKQEKTVQQKCMAEIEEALKKYNCQPLCIPQNMYGQKVYVWAVDEIK